MPPVLPGQDDPDDFECEREDESGEADGDGGDAYWDDFQEEAAQHQSEDEDIWGYGGVAFVFIIESKL